MTVLAEIEKLAAELRDRAGGEPMTPLERFRTAYRFREPDRVPIMLQIHDHAARMAGYTVDAVATDPEKHVHSQLLALKRYGHDLPCGFVDIYNIEVEALGATVRYFPDRLPEPAGPIIDNAGDLDRLESVEPLNGGRIPWVLRVNRLLEETVGEIMGSFAAVTAPLSIAASLRGFERLVYDMVNDPPFAHRLLDFSTRICIRFARLQLESGAGATTIVDAWAAIPLLSPDLFFRYALPYTARAIQALSPPGASWGGIWGAIHMKDWRELVLGVISSGSTTIRAFGEDLEGDGIEIADFKSLTTACGRPLVACISGKLMTYGPAGAIKRQVKHLIGRGAPGGGFVIYGLIVPSEAPPENVHTFIDTAKTCGRYPISV